MWRGEDRDDARQGPDARHAEGPGFGTVTASGYPGESGRAPHRHAGLASDRVSDDGLRLRTVDDAAPACPGVRDRRRRRPAAADLAPPRRRAARGWSQASAKTARRRRDARAGGRDGGHRRQGGGARLPGRGQDRHGLAVDSPAATRRTATPPCSRASCGRASHASSSWWWWTSRRGDVTTAVTWRRLCSPPSVGRTPHDGGGAGRPRAGEPVEYQDDGP